MKKRVVFYARVSTGHEEQLAALDNQVDWYYDLIEKHPEWELVDKYIDEGITGTSDRKRKEFQRMIRDGLEGHEFDLIVTREVPRFARNTVDTLSWTRRLKAAGIGVYFVSDNIDTSDDTGDGELRLSIMASLAQDESRKTSLRVKAGLKTTRDKGMILGTGNILGYDRIGRNQFVVNPVQAETVRCIFKWYLQGNGVKRIKTLLEQNHHLTATGCERWQLSSIARALGNPMYVGYQYQQQSVSDGYLTQKRMNCDKSSFLMVKSSFEPIISEEMFWKVQEVKKQRLTYDCNNHLTGKRDVDDIWPKKLLCSCGSKYRRFRWRTDTYGYCCYNQVQNGKKSAREKKGMSGEWMCDLPSVADWKLDLMMWKTMQVVWKDGQEDIRLACEMIRECYQAERGNDAELIKALIAQRDKKELRRDNLIRMRADGELTKEEFLAKKDECDKELAEVAEKITALNSRLGIDHGMNDMLNTALEVMNQMVDFSTGVIDHDLLAGLVTRIVHVADYEFDVYLNMGMPVLDGAAVGVAEEKVILEKQFSNPQPESYIREYRLRLFDLRIDFDQANEYRKMRKKYLRRNQWNDILVHVYI